MFENKIESISLFTSKFQWHLIRVILSSKIQNICLQPKFFKDINVFSLKLISKDKSREKHIFGNNYRITKHLSTKLVTFYNVSHFPNFPPIIVIKIKIENFLYEVCDIFVFFVILLKIWWIN